MFDNVIEGIFSAAFLFAILRVTTPILLPSLGALISGKSGRAQHRPGRHDAVVGLHRRGRQRLRARLGSVPKPV